MKIWARLVNAVAGWRLILSGEDAWRDRFALTPSGMVTALVIFAFVAFLAVAFAAASVGMPNIFGVLAAMAVLALPLLAVVMALMSTGTMLTRRAPAIDVMVPATYMLAAFLLVEGALAMIGGPIVMASWFLLGYLLYRLARVATSWPAPASIGFAVLSVVVLVAMRMALYMLSSTPA